MYLSFIMLYFTMKNIIRTGLAALVLGLSGIPACSNDTNAPGDQDCVDMSSGDSYSNDKDLSQDSNRDLSGLDKYDLSGTDMCGTKQDLAGADLSSVNDLSGNKKDPPTIELVNGPKDIPYTERTVKANTDTAYKAHVTSPYAGNLSCDFTFSDGYKSGFGNCTINHILNGIGEYTLDAKVKDDSSGLTANTNAKLHAIDKNANIPPVVIITSPAPCPEYNKQDGLCIYSSKVNARFCIDAKDSYDEDDAIVKCEFVADINTGAATLWTWPDCELCVIYISPKVLKASYALTDAGGGEGKVLFYVNVNN